MTQVVEWPSQSNLSRIAVVTTALPGVCSVATILRYQRHWRRRYAGAILISFFSDLLVQAAPSTGYGNAAALPAHRGVDPGVGGVLTPEWYGIVEFNVPLDTVFVISETGGPEQ